jgi:hypothetical protein
MEAFMKSHKLKRHFRQNPEKVPQMTKDTRVFYFGVNKKFPGTHDGVITAFWEPSPHNDMALIGFSFGDPRDEHDRDEAKRGLLRLRAYGSVRQKGHSAKIRNSHFVVEIPKMNTPLEDVAEAFSIIKTRKKYDPKTNDMRDVIPFRFRKWGVTFKTYTNKQGKVVTIPQIGKIE